MRRKLKGLDRVITAINRYRGDYATIRLMYNMATDEVKYTILPPNVTLCDRKEGDIIRFDYQCPVPSPVNRKSANNNIRIACNWIEFFESREEKHE